jgi:hypothetical protein
MAHGQRDIGAATAAGREAAGSPDAAIVLGDRTAI